MSASPIIVTVAHDELGPVATAADSRTLIFALVVPLADSLIPDEKNSSDISPADGSRSMMERTVPEYKTVPSSSDGYSGFDNSPGTNLPAYDPNSYNPNQVFDYQKTQAFQHLDAPYYPQIIDSDYQTYVTLKLQTYASN